MIKSAFPLGDKELKIGILGMTEGNAHPFSWSAMYNGFHLDEMHKWCDELYPTIPNYLSKQPPETIGVPGAHITHVCFTGYEERAMAENCARASNIPNVCDKPEDMIGQVDAVICATDIGSEHVERCKAFIEAGVPMFIDKPMVDNEKDLQWFVKKHDEGAHFISSSSMRYSKAFVPYYQGHDELGKLLYILQPMPKKWETYGIHALEAVYPFLGKGFVSIQNTGTKEFNFAHIIHESGCNVNIPMCYGLHSSGTMLCGSEGSVVLSDSDSYRSFKTQMDNFVHYLRTGEEPFPFEQTIELMKLVIGGLMSREQGGRKVLLSEIHERA